MVAPGLLICCTGLIIFGVGSANDDSLTMVYGTILAIVGLIAISNTPQI